MSLQVAGKRETDQELEAQQWIEQVVGERFPPGVPYEDVLRDGIFLCKLMNKLQPGIITKINVSGGDYKFMDNLSQYVCHLYRKHLDLNKRYEKGWNCNFFEFIKYEMERLVYFYFILRTGFKRVQKKASYLYHKELWTSEVGVRMFAMVSG